MLFFPFSFSHFLLLGSWAMLLVCSLVLALLPALSLGQAPWDAQLFLHPPATVARFGARCLDGSPSGGYFRAAASPSAAQKWRIHFQGGGWCFSADDCLARSRGWGGTSTVWPPLLSGMWGVGGAGFSGLLGANASSINPFGEYNTVWWSYCDGSSWTSDRAAPLLVNQTPLHFRGRAILDAQLYELERKYSFLSSATEVIISGTSAGGMGALLHSSFLRAQLRQPAAKVVAVPDAGWWWDAPAYGNASQRLFHADLTAAIGPGLWNATLRGPSGAACLAAPPAGDRALCFLQPTAYAFNDVPTFVVQSLVDPYNQQYCYASSGAATPTPSAMDTGSGSPTATPTPSPTQTPGLPSASPAAAAAAPTVASGVGSGRGLAGRCYVPLWRAGQGGESRVLLISYS